MVRPLGLKRNPGRGPGLSPSLAVPAITLTMESLGRSQGVYHSACEHMGVMSVLASFAARGSSLAKDPTSGLDHGGGRVLRLGVASPRRESLL
jgi:hypothetical protein